jgi:nucleotide-binding universal stress UspA family protein
MYRNVLVAFDGSDGAKAALSRAAKIAQRDDAAITVVESVGRGIPALVPGGPRLAPSGEAATAREELRAAVASLNPELKASPWAVGGPPAQAVLTVADDIEADLIVTGSRGHGQITSAILGSVSTQILQGAHCDVLVVRPE